MVYQNRQLLALDSYPSRVGLEVLSQFCQSNFIGLKNVPKGRSVKSCGGSNSRFTDSNLFASQLRYDVATNFEEPWYVTTFIHFDGY